jgi:nicotinate phosphoribosyltransferase
MLHNDANASWFERRNLALLTDLYELTMLSGYLRHGLADKPVAFEYFFRTLPPHNGFAITAGLEQFLDYLEHLHFSAEDLEYLDSLALFDASTLEYLRDFTPQLEVLAVPEGTPVFPHEPIIRVTGPIAHAQLVESFLLNALNYQSLIATKTARICQAAQGEPVLEFGLRRAQGPDGGLSGSRAAYIGGAVATSNVLAGKLFGIPVRGTHAHSWVMRFPTELEAFRAFSETFPKSCVLLVDTYDTLRSGVPNAIEIFKSRPNLLPAIRIDSGDLAKLSKSAHAQFARAGMPHVQIIGTNDLDEDLIADLKRQGAKINVWAVGTHLITSKDHPALDGVYKLVAIEDGAAWAPRIKISSNPEKATDPGLKQPYRCWNEKGEPLGDVLLADGEPLPQPGRIEAMDRQYLHQPRTIEEVARVGPLMHPVFGPAGRLKPKRPLSEIRTVSLEQLRAFPEEYLRLRNPEIYGIGLSPRLASMKERLIAKINAAVG